MTFEELCNAGRIEVCAAIFPSIEPWDNDYSNPCYRGPIMGYFDHKNVCSIGCLVAIKIEGNNKALKVYIACLKQLINHFHKNALPLKIADELSIATANSRFDRDGESYMEFALLDSHCMLRMLALAYTLINKDLYDEKNVNVSNLRKIKL